MSKHANKHTSFKSHIGSCTGSCIGGSTNLLGLYVGSSVADDGLPPNRHVFVACCTPQLPSFLSVAPRTPAPLFDLSAPSIPVSAHLRVKGTATQPVTDRTQPASGHPASQRVTGGCMTQPGATMFSCMLHHAALSFLPNPTPT